MLARNCNATNTKEATTASADTLALAVLMRSRDNVSGSKGMHKSYRRWRVTAPGELLPSELQQIDCRFLSNNAGLWRSGYSLRTRRRIGRT